MFTFDQIAYRYADTAGLDGISFTINPGEAVALMGPNGSGKSTLFKLLCGLLQPTGGAYTYNGGKPDFEQLRQVLGFVFQNSDVQLFNDTVEAELAFGPTQLGLPQAVVKQRVDDIMALLDITRLAQRVPYQLSGGEKKLVALGSVLTMNPQTIILDEPFNGLAISYQDQLMTLLQQLHDHGKTLIISSHDYNKTKPLIQRVITLNTAHRIAFDENVAALSAEQVALLQRL
jgi:cobalt/nickel transport system ATP-binding protein